MALAVAVAALVRLPLVAMAAMAGFLVVAVVVVARRVTASILGLAETVLTASSGSLCGADKWQSQYVTL